jgi:hypothetical protein
VTIGLPELIILLIIAAVAIGIPVAALILVYRLWRRSQD